jgi:hypothetical protein
MVPDEEVTMRRFLQSLSPEACRFSWHWVGAMFVFYVAVVAIAANMFTAHQSAKAPMQEPSLAVAVRGQHGGG